MSTSCCAASAGQSTGRSLLRPLRGGLMTAGKWHEVLEMVLNHRASEGALWLPRLRPSSPTRR
jgi:hypothetical protein